jgi:hypothetical protein
MLARRLKRLASPALTAGGLLWVALDVIIVIIGVMTGKLAPGLNAHSPLLMRVGIWLLPTSSLILGVGLLGVFAWLEGRAKGLGVTGVVFTSIALMLALSNAIDLSGAFGFNQHLNNLFGGFAAWAVSIGTGFLGWAALRAKTLSRPLAWLLIAIGLTTIPVLLATPLPIGPDWATDFLAFLLSGIAYTIVGIGMLSARQPTGEATTSAVPQLAAQPH